MFGLESLRNSNFSQLTATGQHCFPSLSVNELAYGSKVHVFQSFPSQVRKMWPLSFQNWRLRQSQRAADISVLVNPVQAMVSLVRSFVYALATLGRVVLADCMTGSTKQPKFLNKKIWSSLNIGGQISVFHLWQPMPNSRRTDKFVLWNLREITDMLQLIFYFKLHANLNIKHRK